MQPIIKVSCTHFEGLTQPSVTCKLLNVQDSYRLKRLASAVRFRPWPPCFQSLADPSKPIYVPKRHKIITALSLAQATSLPLFSSTQECPERKYPSSLRSASGASVLECPSCRHRAA